MSEKDQIIVYKLRELYPVEFKHNHPIPKLSAILDLGIANLDILTKLMSDPVTDISLVCTIAEYSELLKYQSLVALDSSDTILGEIFIDKIDNRLVVKSIKVGCYRILYRLILHAEYYNIYIPKTVKLETT